MFLSYRRVSPYRREPSRRQDKPSPGTARFTQHLDHHAGPELLHGCTTAALTLNKTERQETSSFSPQFKNQTVCSSRCGRPHDHEVGGGTSRVRSHVDGGITPSSCPQSHTDSHWHAGPGQSSVPSSHAWISSGGLHLTVKFRPENILLCWMTRTSSALPVF